MAYLDREKTIKALEDALSYIASDTRTAEINNIVRKISMLPTADVVEVVRCEKCTHKIDYKGRVMCKRNAYIIALEFGEEWCGLTATKNDHFCSCGERRNI